VTDLALDRVPALERDLEMVDRHLGWHRQARIAAPSTAGTLVQLASWSSAVIRRMS
jgi:hypothetical protein